MEGGVAEVPDAHQNQTLTNTRITMAEEASPGRKVFRGSKRDGKDSPVVNTTQPRGGWHQEMVYTSNDGECSFQPLIIALKAGDGSRDDDSPGYFLLMRDAAWATATMEAMKTEDEARSWYTGTNGEQARVGLLIKHPDGQEELVGEAWVYRLAGVWPEVYCVLKGGKYGKDSCQRKGYGTKFMTAFLEKWWSLPRETGPIKVQPDYVDEQERNMSEVPERLCANICPGVASHKPWYLSSKSP
ncbi:hypothetical protein P171DRAFT_497004 [Karstenula rhodostoma CBS 690.94]|uniref:Uncharacterized protein n=1 Tax=Karstenula rhodostoma CBS 690.94 TaxID=1392251 RepID=A0A9P4UAG5_9PLEO|nr:hypothetical protein P171DRAFT_497004 [Karstenula rhodostoma CBS 690.94]